MELQKLFVTLALDASEYQDGLVKTAAIASATFKAVEVVTNAAVEATKAALKFATDSVNAAADMEAQLSNIGAVLGATKDEIAPLATLIKDLGLNPNLKVSATEAADAIEMLARNGLNMTQILDGAAEATVLLANSTGADFATAANIGTDAMAIFKIEASDMMQAVNGITGVTVSSKFGIEDYALALAQAGGVAAASGVGFDDFNTAIAAISPLFASGSDAGTSFKVMLQRLVPASGAAAGEMANLGIISANTETALDFLRTNGVEPYSTSVEDVTNALYGWAQSQGQTGDKARELLTSMGLLQNQFFDTEGNLRSMSDIAGVLQTSFSGLSEEQRNQALSTIFGTDAMRAAVAMMDLGGQGFAELQATMSQTDALESAAMRMDNLSGAMEILEGIIDTVKLSFGQALLPVIRAVVDGLILFANEQMPVIEAAFTRLSEILIAGTPPFETFANLVAFLTQTFGASAEQAAMVQQSLLLVQQTVMTILEPVANLVASFVSWQDILIAVGLILASVVIPALLSLLATVATIAAPILAVIAVVALLRTAWEQNWGGIQEKTQAVIDFIVPLVNGAIATIQAWWAQNGDEILAKAAEIWAAVKLAVETAVAVVVAVAKAAIAEVQAFWAENGAAILAKATEIWNSVKGAVETAVATVKTIANDGIAQIQAFWAENGAAILAKATEIWTQVVEWVRAKLAEMEANSQSFLTSIAAYWEAHKELIIGVAQSLWDLVVQIFETAKELIVNVITLLLSVFTGDWETAKESVINIAQSLWDLVVQIFETAVTTISNIVLAIISAITSPFETTSWGSIGTAVVDGIAGGISSTAGKIEDAAVEAAKAAWEAAKAFLGISSPSKLFYDLWAWVPEGAADALTDGIGTVVSAMSRIGDAATVAALEGFGKIADAIGKLGQVFDIIEQLRNLDTGSSVEGAMLWLNHQILLMAQAMRAGQVTFGGGGAETEAYAKLVQTVVKSLVDAAELVGLLQEVNVSSSVEPTMLWLNYQMLAMARAVRAGAVEFGGLGEETAAYAKVASEAAAALADAAEAVTAVSEIQIVPDAKARIDYTISTIGYFSLGLQKLVQDTDTSTSSAPLAEWVAAEIDSILGIIDSLAALIDADVPGGVAEVVAAIQVQLDALPIHFHNSAVDSVNAMIDVFRDGSPLIAEAARNAAAAAAAEARAVFDGVGVGAPSPVAVPVATGGRDGAAPPINVYGNVTLDGSGGAGSLQEQLRNMA